MKTTTRFAAVSIAALTLAVASALAAQPGAGMGPGAGAGPCIGAGPGAGTAMGMGHGMRGRGPGGWNAEAVGARLDALKAEIGITAAQESAWQAFAGVAQQHAEQRQAMRTQMRSQMQDPQAAAPADRDAHREAMQSLRQQHWSERDAARDGLYAVLTPEQKALAEQRLAGGPGRRGAMCGGPGR